MLTSLTDVRQQVLPRLLNKPLLEIRRPLFWTFDFSPLTDESGADVEIWDAVTAHAPCLFTHRLEPIIACYQPVCSRQRWSAMQKRIDRRRIWIQEIVITEDYSLTVRMTEDYQLSVPAISSPEHGDIFWVIYVGVGESLMCTSENRKPELLHFDGTGEYTVVNMGD